MHNDKDRKNTRIAIYLVGMKDNKVLLGKRIHTQHMNGYWSLPAGHVREYETCLEALLREAREECGISVDLTDIKLRGIMHHFSPPFDYINYIYLVNLQDYTVHNTEPNKCESLSFFSINNLPAPMQDYIVFIINKTIEHEQLWSVEYGWND